MEITLLPTADSLCCYPAKWSLLFQSEMRAILMVVVQVLFHQSLQMTLVQGDHMIEQISSAVVNPAFGHVLRKLVRLGAMPMLFTVSMTSALKLVARSKIRYFDAVPKGNALRSCWVTQALVGCLVTLQCRIRLLSWEITKKQYNTPKVRASAR
jgi:hypothetical protein